MEPAIRLRNQRRKYYSALITLTLLNAICKLQHGNISGTFTLMIRFDGQYFDTAGSSKFSHRETYGIMNYMNTAVTTGCNQNSECGAKTEVMNMETLEWSNGPDFPFAS